MFDIGWSELLVVLVVALVVVGPKDLPRLMRTVGRWVGKARAMADQFRTSFDEMARETELDELRAEIEALRRSNPLNRVQEELNRAILPPATRPAELAGEGGPVQDAQDTDVAAAPEPETAASPSGLSPERPETTKASSAPGSDPSAP